MNSYTKTRRTDNTVRVDTPLGNHIWIERLFDIAERVYLHTSVSLAGHMRFVDDLNELPYVTVTAVRNHEADLSPDVRGTVEMTALTKRAIRCLLEDLTDIYENEFHERRLARLAKKGGAA